MICSQGGVVGQCVRGPATSSCGVYNHYTGAYGISLYTGAYGDVHKQPIRFEPADDVTNVTSCLAAGITTSFVSVQYCAIVLGTFVVISTPLGDCVRGGTLRARVTLMPKPRESTIPCKIRLSCVSGFNLSRSTKQRRSYKSGSSASKTVCLRRLPATHLHGVPHVYDGTTSINSHC